MGVTPDTFSSTPAVSPPSAISDSATTDTLANSYADVLTDDRFVIEWQEGTKRGVMMSPKDMKALIDINRENDALAARRAGGLFKQIVD